MSSLRKLTTALVGSALLATSASPALARPWGHGGWDRPGWGYRHRPHRHYRGDGFDFGDFLLGAIVAGGIAAAIASSKEKRDGNRDRSGGRYEDRSSDRAVEDRAAELCSDAAESEAARQGNRDARVADISYVGRDGDGWRVEGRLSDRDRYRIGDAFVCGVSNGRVDYVRISDAPDTYRG
jgi:hypothetical protein